MINQLTIIMYHYVRDVEQTSFPNIKARSIKQFTNQLEYLKQNYNVITPLQFISAITENSPLPKNSALLTFDDGYIDHYTNVLPILKKYKFKAMFAPVVQSAMDKKVLDVNKIHFVLSVMESQIEKVIKDIFSLMNKYRNQYKLKSNEYYYNLLAKPSRFDSAEVIFVKRILQRELPQTLRSEIIDVLFKKYITEDEADFASTLYMNEEHLKELYENDMEIIGHSYTHCWLGYAPQDVQLKEVQLTKDFISAIRNCDDNLIFCYPYGSWNNSLLNILKSNNFIAGFTTEVAIASDKHDPLLLPRLDTNDIPY